MKFRLIHAAAAAMLCATTAPAQDMEQGIPPNVLDAIREFNQRDTPEKPAETPAPAEPTEASEQKPAAEEVDDVIASILADEPEKTTPEANAPPPESEPTPDGPAVRVQALRTTNGSKVDPSDVKISAPFAAKPIGRAPEGWKLVKLENAPEFVENVEVAPGTWLTLSIRPHVLVPDADGRTVFQIPEPGFNPTVGYHQDTTISSAIASSLDQLEDDARVLGQVIDQLEQILISLPKPAILTPETEEKPE
jgi:hypothetical protein